MKKTVALLSYLIAVDALLQPAVPRSRGEISDPRPMRAQSLPK